MIDQQTKQRIYDTAKILDVVSDFVSLKRHGASYLGLCPFHSDRKPSFHVSPAKNICKCFACGEGGSPLNFVMKHEQLSYGEALRYLARKYNIEIVEREVTDEEREAANERQSLFLINDYAQKFYHSQMQESPEGQTIALSYFRERGIRPETMEAFSLGYAPGGSKTAFTESACSAGYSLERLVKLGLSLQDERGGGRPPIDRFRERVMFPVRNLSGQYVAFGGRTLNKENKAKYVNSPESSIYSKSRELYGLYQAKGSIQKADKCYIVEGYIDVLSMYQSGVTNVVASSGTALTVEQIRLISRFTKNVTLLFDGDAAGIKAALRGTDLLLEEGMNVRVVPMPQGEDPDSFAQSHTSDELVAYLEANEMDFIHYKLQLSQEVMQRDPLLKAKVVQNILASIALIPDSITRGVLSKSIAEQLQMPEKLLLREVGKLRQQGVRAGGYIAPTQPSVAPEVATSSPHPEVTQAPPTNAQPSVTAEPSLPPAFKPYPYEVELLRFVILQGEQEVLILEEDEAGEPYLQSYQIASYLSYLLSELHGRLSPFFLEVLSQATEYCLPQALACASFFTNYDKDEIRRLAVDFVASDMMREGATPPDQMEEILISDLATATEPARQTQALQALERYRNERSERQLLELGNKVIREVDGLDFALVIEDIQALHQELKQVQKDASPEQIKALLDELNALNEHKIALGDKLGERTILT